jgi:quercetin dioxygenase-like cupin family protein
MAIPHAQPGEMIRIAPLGPRLANATTTTLVKTDALEVIRLVVPADKRIADHRTRGEVTIQCLEGEVGIVVHGVTTVLSQNEMLYLRKGETHAVRGIQDASLLVTILLN